MTDRLASHRGAIRRASRWLAAVALLAITPWAAAGYFQWDVVELPASSGASCGNGTPYRFFVNRTPFTRELVVSYEGGGACWGQEACEGKGKLNASNPNGVPANYMMLPNAALGGYITPFTTRLNAFQWVRTQGWNQVYLPYCTGDVHTGSALRIYDDANPAQPRVQHHAGQANVRAAAAWLRANLGRPSTLLVHGASAGGAGSTATYALMRDALQPSGRASLLADSGPLFDAPRGAPPERAPSLGLHERIRAAWGLDAPDGLISRLAGMVGFDTGNLGSVARALSLRYPNDRFGYMVFQADGIYSAFNYAPFYADIANAPDEATARALIAARWRTDLGNWTMLLNSLGNVSYHLPFFRDFNESHCLTLIDFSGTGIEERGIPSLSRFVDNTLDRGAPMRNIEFDQTSDLSRPISAALQFFKGVLALMGGL